MKNNQQKFWTLWNKEASKFCDGKTLEVLPDGDLMHYLWRAVKLLQIADIRFPEHIENGLDRIEDAIYEGFGFIYKDSDSMFDIIPRDELIFTVKRAYEWVCAMQDDQIYMNQMYRELSEADQD